MALPRFSFHSSRLVSNIQVRPFFASPCTVLSPAKAVNTPCKIFTRRMTSSGTPEVFWNHRRKNLIKNAIIGVNIGVSALWAIASVEASKSPPKMELRRMMIGNFTTSLAHLRSGKYWTLLTSTISQASPFHLLGNIITFHAFSTVLFAATPLMTASSFATLCVGSALTGSAGWIWYELSRKRNNFALGASGMVAGVGAAAALAAPKARMLLMGIVPAPLWVLVFGYAFMDSYFLDSNSRIGHAAHLGGFVFGGLFWFLSIRRGRLSGGGGFRPFR